MQTSLTAFPWDLWNKTRFNTLICGTLFSTPMMPQTSCTVSTLDSLCVMMRPWALGNKAPQRWRCAHSAPRMVLCFLQQIARIWGCCGSPHSLVFVQGFGMFVRWSNMPTCHTSTIASSGVVLKFKQASMLDNFVVFTRCWFREVNYALLLFLIPSL